MTNRSYRTPEASTSGPNDLSRNTHAAQDRAGPVGERVGESAWIVASLTPVPGVSLAHAPLAQSAERFHGKEEVDSSILSGSSLPFRRQRGDVAQ